MSIGIITEKKHQTFIPLRQVEDLPALKRLVELRVASRLDKKRK